MSAALFEYGLERHFFPTLHSKVTIQANLRDKSCLQCICELHAHSFIPAMPVFWINDPLCRRLAGSAWP